VTPDRPARPTLTFGDDGTPAADVAWLWISEHSWTGWRLEVVTVTDVPIAPPPPEEARLHPWDPPRPRHAFEETGFAEVEHLTARIDPRLALSTPTDLLVIGPKGPGLLKGVGLGSTAEWLVQHPPSPLVVARTGAPTRRVLAAHDGSPHAQRALTTLAGLPWVAGVELVVLTVDDGRADVDAASALVDEALAGAPVEAVRVVATDRDPTTVILQEYRAREPDLLVLGTVGLTGWRRLRLGSTAGAVARSVPGSVLLARADVPGENP